MGSIVNLSKAQGDFVLEETPAPLLFIAGGSGITPFRSMLQQQAMSPKSEELDIHLLYYSRNSEQIAFQQELEQLHLNLFRSKTNRTWQQHVLAFFER